MTDSGFRAKNPDPPGFENDEKKLETSMWNCWGRVINGVGQI